jgi:hypothetical protein
MRISDQKEGDCLAEHLPYCVCQAPGWLQALVLLSHIIKIDSLLIYCFTCGETEVQYSQTWQWEPGLAFPFGPQFPLLAGVI